VWQALHLELSPAGLSIVTVALDTNIEAARPFAEAAHPTHPSLIDPAHQLVELFGFTNIPFGLWVNEQGVIVRPSDVAFVPAQQRSGIDNESWRRQEEITRAARASMTPERRDTLQKMTAGIDRTGRYVDAVRDWVANGPASRYALSPDEVVERSRPRPVEFGLAAAEFELAQHLHLAGFGIDAVPHFKEAHRLDPTNWSYLRQALALADPEWGPVYERDMMSELAIVGADTFYPPLDL
jgi:hypothetical protein